jgi:hypothetical protein
VANQPNAVEWTPEAEAKLKEIPFLSVPPQGKKSKNLPRSRQKLITAEVISKLNNSLGSSSAVKFRGDRFMFS